MKKKIIDPKKGLEAASNVLQKSYEVGKKAAVNVQTGAKNIADKSKSDSYMRRLKKYNPLFPEVYTSNEFNVPNIIMIVDDAERRGIDVCEGAIGWLGKANEIEILYLYDTAIEISGIIFEPSADCDSIYYVDNFDKSRFIRADDVFTRAHKNKLAELKHIAFSLGAKRCTIEISETDTEKSSSKKTKKFSEEAKFADNEATTSESLEQSQSSEKSNQRTGRITAEFEGSDTPERPELKWFAHDENIKKLIDMRFNEINSIKSETFEISGASTATMNEKIACAMDMAVKKSGFKGSVKGSADISSQASKESHSKMIYIIEF